MNLAEFSFDVTSEVNLQIVDNAVNTANKEIANRYDFRGSIAKITRENDALHLVAEDDYKIRAMTEMFRAKAAKQGIQIKFFDFSTKVDDSLGGNFKQQVPINQGISKEKGKEINIFIKDLKLKAHSQIQDNKIRVSGKSKDDLQKVMVALKGKDFGIALEFGNYR
ncbi:YajQ family cyclic di-GMP-binding protein [Candidatus Margulisiibacteriota bacterium]